MVEPSVPGDVRCMKCRKVFYSPDRVRIRRCPGCKRNEGSIYVPPEVSTRDLNGNIRGHQAESGS